MVRKWPLGLWLFIVPGGNWHLGLTKSNMVSVDTRKLWIVLDRVLGSLNLSRN